MEANMSDPDAFGSLMIVFACLISSLMMLLYLASMIWVFIDAQAKGKTGCLWLLLVFFT
jgi:hypothetical protein